jgi:hypothetical protein
MITMAAAPAVNRTGIHTCPATDTFQGVPEIGAAQLLASAVIYKYDVNFLSCTGPFKMT